MEMMIIMQNIIHTVMARVFIVIAMIAGILFLISCHPSSDDDSYNFPIKPGTDEWADLGDNIAMINACQIPEDILTDMSTKGLVRTVLEYPLFFDVWAHNFVQDGFDSVAGNFNGIRELLSRKDSGIELMDVYGDKDPAAFQENWTDIQKVQYGMSFSDIEVLLAQDQVLTSLSQVQCSHLLEDTLDKYNVKIQNPEYYGIFGTNCSLFLMGRILQRLNYAPFITHINEDEGFSTYITKGSFPNTQIVDEILLQIEQYLAEK
jgi:hypothetical protein